MLSVVKVVGSSMKPTLDSGDFVLTTRLFRRLRVGDLVVCKHRQYDTIIKRVTSIEPSGTLKVAGDAPDSLQEEDFGPLSLEDIKSKVLFSIRR